MDWGKIFNRLSPRRRLVAYIHAIAQEVVDKYEIQVRLIDRKPETTCRELIEEQE